MTKRDRILALASGTPCSDYVPAAFFSHFEPSCHRGRAAVEKHLEYFRATGNDLVKVQYEHKYPTSEGLKSPADWASFPLYGRDFYRDQIEVVRGVVEQVKDEAVVIVTLYSALMFAMQASGEETFVKHINEDPEPVARGLDIIAESMTHLIQGCIDAGADGFYASTQGGEAGRLGSSGIFESYIKPVDLRVWETINEKCSLNILHVCDYKSPYSDLSLYLDYPGQIVSASLDLTDRKLTGREISQMFGRPFLGGMDRLAELAIGPTSAIESAARTAIGTGPEAMILGANCTIPSETSWANMAAAVDTAHTYRA